MDKKLINSVGVTSTKQLVEPSLDVARQAMKEMESHLLTMLSAMRCMVDTSNFLCPPDGYVVVIGQNLARQLGIDTLESKVNHIHFGDGLK